MKKWLCVLCAAAALACGGCGTKETAETVSMYDLRVAMEAADDSLPAMLNVSSAEANAEDNFSHITEDMDYDRVEGYFVSYAGEGGLADEIVVIAMKDASDAEEAKECLKEHRQSRYKLLEQYEPKQTKRIEDGLVFSSGQYAVLIICDNSSAVKKAFEQMVDGD